VTLDRFVFRRHGLYLSGSPRARDFRETSLQRATVFGYNVTAKSLGVEGLGDVERIPVTISPA